MYKEHQKKLRATFSEQKKGEEKVGNVIRVASTTSDGELEGAFGFPRSLGKQLTPSFTTNGRRSQKVIGNCDFMFKV